jgi:hypothetical protein
MPGVRRAGRVWYGSTGVLCVALSREANTGENSASRVQSRRELGRGQAGLVL